MAEKQEDPIQGTLKDMDKNIKMKRSLVKTLELEYKNVCKKTESNLKILEDLRRSINTLEVQSSSSEHRLEKYQTKATELEKENHSLQQDLDDAKKSFNEARKLDHEEDVKFNQNVIKLVAKRRKNRKIYDSKRSKDSLHKLKLLSRAIVKENVMYENMLKLQKKKRPFEVSDEFKYFLDNSSISAPISQEIDHLYQKKTNALKKLDDMMEKVKVLEEEISKLKN